MTITYHPDVEQGSDEWLKLRRGKLTASEMKLVVSKKTNKKTGEITYAAPNEDKYTAHIYELAAQRTTEFVEPTYVGDDMLRGREDELDAKLLYNEKIAPLQDVGFITNDKWGFTIGYSPDALVGEDGLVEVKGRKQKFQFQTFFENKVPEDYIIQVQTGLLVSERKWMDFISYCGGMPMYVTRVYPDEKVQEAIVSAATAFEEKIKMVISIYNINIIGSLLTNRRENQDIVL